MATAFSLRHLFGVAPGSQSAAKNAETTSNRQPRIAIVGGGIAGVTAANALGKKFADQADRDAISPKIVVFEGDVKGGHRRVNFGNCEQPTWIAATARNANSLVPGAAMHVMCQRSTLWKIAKDTLQEWYFERVESIQHWLQADHQLDYQLTKRIDNFDVVPPYFALHLFRCIGPSATWDERATFFTFLKQFLLTSVFTDEAHANERGRYCQQLAQSNRHSFLGAINGGAEGKALASKVGVGKGFVSLHRTSDSAINAFNEGKLYGETTVIIPIEEAIKLEPRISNLPIKNQLFGVHRIDDYTANSAVFVQDLVEKIQEKGTEYRCGEVGLIEDIALAKTDAAETTKGRFTIRTKDGSSHAFDYVVLAAGVNTPLFARKLSVGDACPTYPLRGYSLTAYTNHTQDGDGNGRLGNGRSSNLLNMPLSIDDMYCSSVGVNMARMAGFGELVGYRDKAVDVPSLGPKVLGRYAKALFPDANITEETALPCFRPMSPDDLPIVGQVRSLPGLFMHTGHGTLGWTLCLATSECLAQALYDDFTGNQTESTYQLPGEIEVERARMSPDRFL
ncbi:hypothetical protein ACHAXT_000340 [Thalassiosira profunda]